MRIWMRAAKCQSPFSSAIHRVYPEKSHTKTQGKKWGRGGIQVRPYKAEGYQLLSRERETVSWWDTIVCGGCSDSRGSWKHGLGHLRLFSEKRVRQMENPGPLIPHVGTVKKKIWSSHCGEYNWKTTRKIKEQLRGNED